MARSIRRAIATAPLLVFVIVVYGSCLRAPGTTGPEIEALLVLHFQPQISPVLMDPQEPLNITHAQWDIRAGPSRKVLSVASAELDTDIPDALVVTVELTVAGGELEPEGHIRLIGDGGGAEWAGLFGPVLVDTKQEVWTFQVQMGRGDLTNLSVQSLTISGLENGLEQAATGSLSAATDGAQGTVIFWGSRNPAVATVNAQGVVHGVSPGEATIVAVVGLKADSVVVRVHPPGD